MHQPDDDGKLLMSSIKAMSMAAGSGNNNPFLSLSRRRQPMPAPRSVMTSVTCLPSPRLCASSPCASFSTCSSALVRRPPRRDFKARLPSMPSHRHRACAQPLTWRLSQDVCPFVVPGAAGIDGCARRDAWRGRDFSRDGSSDEIQAGHRHDQLAGADLPPAERARDDSELVVQPAWAPWVRSR